MDSQRAIQLLQAHIDAADMPLFSQAAAIGIRALERVDMLEAELATTWQEAANLIRQTTPKPSVLDSYERGKYDGRMDAIQQLEGMAKKEEMDLG